MKLTVGDPKSLEIKERYELHYKMIMDFQKYYRNCIKCSKPLSPDDIVEIDKETRTVTIKHGDCGKYKTSFTGRPL